MNSLLVVIFRKNLCSLEKQHFFTVLKNYFEQYKVLENKKVEIGEFEGKEQAEKLLKECQKAYQNEKNS